MSTSNLSSTIQNYPIFHTENFNRENINYIAFLLAASLLITVYIQKLLRLVHLRVGEHLLFVVLSYGVALIVVYAPKKEWYIMNSAPRDVVAILLPLRIFVTVFHADLHILLQRVPQLILMNTIGMSIFIVIYGVTMSCYLALDIKWDIVIGLGVSMVSTDSHSLVKTVNNIEISSASKALVLAECLTVYGHSMILLDIFIGYQEGILSSFYHIIFVHLRMLLIGMFLGCACGKICTTFVNPLFHNHQYLIMAWIIMAYIMFIICNGYLGVSGCFAVLSYAIFMSTEKNRLSMRSFQKMQFIIDGWQFIVTAYTHLLTFSNSFLFLMQSQWTGLFFYTPVSLICVILARAAGVLLLYSFLFRQARNKANLLLTLIFQRRGVLELNKLRMILHNPMTYHLKELHNLAFGVILFEVIWRNIGLNFVFKTFGTNVINAARKANISSCFDLLESTRQTYLHMFQMDRNYGDADWKLIEAATNLRDKRRGDTKIDQTKDHYGCRPSCLECQENAGLILNSYQKAEKLKELKALVLRTQKVSFVHQRERGLIQKADLKFLFNALDITELSTNLHIEVPELSILYKRSYLQNLKKVLINISTDVNIVFQQKAALESNLARILLHPAYDIAIYIFVILNVIVFYHNIFATCVMQLVILIPYSIFAMDTVLKFLLFLRLLKHYSYNLYNTAWNQFDVFMFFVNTIEVIIVIFRVNCELYNIFGYVMLLGPMFIGQLRLLKLIQLTQRLRKWIIKVCDYFTEARVFTGYSRALSILFSYHEVLHILPTLVENIELRRIMEKEIIKEKAIILAQLCNVQHKFTRVAVKAKTQRIINTSVATMHETIVALKLMGFTDENENSELVERVEKLRKPILKMSCTEVNSASQILRWLPFFEAMSGFEALYKEAVQMEYAPDELILVPGKMSDGIYIIIEGLASMTIIADPVVRSRMKQYGALPIKDYLCDVDYYRASIHYVQAGNSIGILSFLTNRPCDYEVRTVVPTKVFFLHSAAMKRAMLDNSDPVYGLHSRLWKYVTVNLALSIMWKVPMYRNLRVEETYYYMEKSFVPNTRGKKSILISDDVEDLLLVEGKIRDKISRKVYVAPCYVPRSVRKMSFIRNVKMPIEPQLFIIPLKPEMQVKIFENFEALKRAPTFAVNPVTGELSADFGSTITPKNYSKRMSLASAKLLGKDKDQSIETSQSSTNKLEGGYSLL